MKEITTYTRGTVLKLHRFSPEMRAVTIGVPRQHIVSFPDLQFPKHLSQAEISTGSALSGQTLEVSHTFRPGPAFHVRASSAIDPNASKERYYSASLTTSQNGVMHALETVIDKAHEHPDTSARWQEDDIVEGMSIDVALSLKFGDGMERPHFEIFKFVSKRFDLSVELEDDSLWSSMKFLLYGPGTGFAPFLYYIRYMAEREFGHAGNFPGADVVAVMCVKHAPELMFDDELQGYERRFPQNLRIVRIVTRERVPHWPLVRLRRPLIRCPDNALSPRVRAKSIVNMRALEYLVPDLGSRNLRVCGSHQAWQDISDGYAQLGYHDQIASARRETWG